jgi:proteasome lid subunit RPN8/RPN11
MYFEIVVDRKVEAAFRRRARLAYPNEMLETMWGRFRGATIHVHAFMPVEHRGKPEIVHYKHEDLDQLEDEAREHRLELVGTIHTHPNRLNCMYSEGDLADAQETQDVIMGICTVTPERVGNRTVRKTAISYWLAPRPLKVQRK